MILSGQDLSALAGGPAAGSPSSGPCGGKGAMYRHRHGDRPLEGYTIQRGVGRGGFGEVYYALSDAGREVALKMVLHNEEIELRGVKHCLNLKSPHLVSIFDVRTGEEGLSWVIMEYVTGPSLRDLLREHPQGLGVQKSAFLAREIAKGLAYLHDRGIVHRDLKPENIFYEDGYVKIGDYGLSKIITGSRQSNQTISVGTVHYMAPEIGTGSYQKSVDIYALGVILHELLTGEVPFKGDSFGEILMKHLTMEPDLSGLEEPFRSVVGCALKKDPRDRYPSVGDLVAGFVDDPSVNLSLSSFNPATLSQAAEGFWRREGTAAASPLGSSPLQPPLDSPLVRESPTIPASPVPAGEPGAPRPGGAREATAGRNAAGRAAAGRTAAGRTAAGRTAAGGRVAGAGSEPENVAQVLREAAAEIKRRAVRNLTEKFRLVSERIARVGTPRPAPRGAAVPLAASPPPAALRLHPQPEVLPRPATRVFWVFLASALLAGAVSCLAAPLIIDFRGRDDILAPLGFGTVFLSYASFAFYRGLKARSPTFWRRSLRPFLLATALGTVPIPLLALYFGPGLGWFPEQHGDMAVMWAIVLAIAIAGGALIFLLEPLFAHWSRAQASAPRDLPWSSRPVPVPLRGWDLLLATGFAVAGIATFIIGGLDEWNNDWDRFAFIGFAIALGALGFFFYRQAFRRCRGTIWCGTVRPFLLTAVVATIMICFLPVFLGVQLRDEDVMVLVIAGSIALGLLVPLVVLRGPSIAP
jgi:serine/threonine protein kinase